LYSLVYRTNIGCAFLAHAQVIITSKHRYAYWLS